MAAPMPSAFAVEGVATLGRWVAAAVVRPAPTGALYSVLLLAHVAAAVIGFGALAVTGVQAGRARAGPAQPGADAVRRYFRPGVNWPGRVVYGVPVLGFALVADSRSAFDAGDGFVVIGLVLWALSVAVAEAVLWPAERRIQETVTERWGDDGVRGQLRRDCTVVARASAMLVALFVLSVVVMVGKP